MSLVASVRIALNEIAEERIRQHAQWGEQNHPDGTGGPGTRLLADLARESCDTLAALGVVTYADILQEEFAEALAEKDKAKLRVELIQVAAVATAWIEKLDREANAVQA